MTPLSPDQARVRQSFRRGLASYHGQARVQADIARTLASGLASAGAPPHFGQALEFGCGTGHLTAALLAQFRINILTLNDLVPDCAAHLQPLLDRHKIGGHFLEGPIESLPLPQGLDLVASASTIQWLASPETLLPRLTDCLAPGGWLALSGFARGHFPELQGLNPEAAAPGYRDPDEWRAVMPAGLTLLSLTSEVIRLTFPDAISLLRHLRLTGVNGRARQHWTRAALTSFSDRISHPDGALTLTYRPTFLIAQKTG
ncbi:MAG: methyltransferase domain-containing protein [Rhodobacteraceae bacterium]|nr:methyltransferase domain-containing protein [Paracoccaceae bacterium]